MQSDYKPKLSIEITAEQQSALRSINLPFGWQRAIFSEIIDDLIDMNKVFGSEALAIIIARRAKPSTVIPTMVNVKTYDQKLSKGDSNGPA